MSEKVKMLEVNCWLIVPSKATRFGQGVELCQPRIMSAKNSRQKLRVGAGEVAIYATIRLPETLFKKPQFTATIAVSESAVGSPVIDAEVCSNISKLVASQLGIELVISQEPAE